MDLETFVARIEDKLEVLESFVDEVLPCIQDPKLSREFDDAVMDVRACVNRYLEAAFYLVEEEDV